MSFPLPLGREVRSQSDMERDLYPSNGIDWIDVDRPHTEEVFQVPHSQYIAKSLQKRKSSGKTDFWT
jgi:hypothetical protein